MELYLLIDHWGDGDRFPIVTISFLSKLGFLAGLFFLKYCGSKQEQKQFTEKLCLLCIQPGLCFQKVL